MNQISRNAIIAYRERFPNDYCCYEEPSGFIFITPEGSDISYLQPYEETEDQFLDRLNRSVAAGRNLFPEEWPELVYKDDCYY